MKLKKKMTTTTAMDDHPQLSRHHHHHHRSGGGGRRSNKQDSSVVVFLHRSRPSMIVMTNMLFFVMLLLMVMVLPQESYGFSTVSSNLQNHYQPSSFVYHHHHHHHHSSSSSSSSSTSCVGRSDSRSSSIRTSTSLFSLQSMVDSIITTASSSSNNNSDGSNKNKKKKKITQTIFVGGKGGVGKTTTASALAVQLASSSMAAASDLKVLIVSTDPAHSLGDALDEDLKRTGGTASTSATGITTTSITPITLTDPITQGRLQAAEINAASAMNDFRTSLQSFDIDTLATSLGISKDILESLGLQEFTNLVNNPPPGLDELIALSNIFSDTTQENYDVVIVDTAPTGHTLRLLALPQFLTGFVTKLLSLRSKLSGIASTLQSFLSGGGDAAQQRATTIDNTIMRLEEFQKRITNLQLQLMDPTKTSFLVVTVPTKLAIAESKRLISELQTQHIAVNHIVVNQCIIGGEGKTNSNNDDGISEEALTNYYSRRRAGQTKWIRKLQEAIDKVSASEEYKSNDVGGGGGGDVNGGGGPNGGGGGGSGSSKPIAITQLPFFDVELVGVPALGYVGFVHLATSPDLQHLMTMQDIEQQQKQPKVVICGGKGGVGKTTTSASLAVTMAAQGHSVALISTDPAHSLGDAIDMNLNGGKLIDCPLIGVPSSNPAEQGSLSVLEVDPSAALGDFKGIVDQLIGVGGGAGDKDGPGASGSDIRGTLRELEQVFDTLPAGTDEVVALAQVVNLVKKGGFDRIVLDTAPTGHTLRMLSTPGFLAELIDRLLGIAEKVNSNVAMKLLINSGIKGSGGNSEQVEAAGAAAKSKLLSFQLQMYDLEDMFANPEQTEFLIVTVPTELAVRESVRLLNDLTFEAPDMPIKVRNIVVNQVLTDDGSDIQTFVQHVRDSQSTSIRDLEQSLATSNVQITKIPYLDTEPRGVFGLKILAEELMRSDAKTEA